jgi:hypothetical protein
MRSYFSDSSLKEFKLEQAYSYKCYSAAMKIIVRQPKPKKHDDELKKIKYTTHFKVIIIMTCRRMESSIFRDVTPCSPVNQRFGRTFRLNFQGRRVNQARNEREVGNYIPPKRRLTFNGLYGVISQKIYLHKYHCQNVKSST